MRNGVEFVILFSLPTYAMHEYGVHSNDPLLWSEARIIHDSMIDCVEGYAIC